MIRKVWSECLSTKTKYVTPNSAQFVFFFQVIILDLLHVGLQRFKASAGCPPFQRATLSSFLLFPPRSADFFGLIVLNFSVSRCQDFFSRTRFSAVLMIYSYRYRLIVLWLFYPRNATGPPANFFFQCNGWKICQIFGDPSFVYTNVNHIPPSGIYNLKHRTRIIFTLISGVWQGAML